MIYKKTVKKAGLRVEIGLDEKSTPIKNIPSFFRKAEPQTASKQRSRTRADRHGPKMLIIQLHKLSLCKNSCHISFINFAKMVSSNFHRTFFLLW